MPGDTEQEGTLFPPWFLHRSASCLPQHSPSSSSLQIRASLPRHLPQPLSVASVLSEEPQLEEAQLDDHPHQGLTCFCSLHFSHQFLHAGHVSILDCKDKVLFTTHSDYGSGLWASESRKTQGTGPVECQFAMSQCFGGPPVLGEPVWCLKQWAPCQAEI